MKQIFIISVAILFSLGFSYAAVADSIMVYTMQDKAIFEEYVNNFNARRQLPINELFMETGFYFIETPYVNYTLEVAKPDEKLIINLRELDCTTFTETCLALARTLKSDNISFETYAQELLNIRYRNGSLNGYSSRLHYFSDWIFDNTNMDIVKDITTENGGVSFPVKFSLMTTCGPKNYPQLADTLQLQQIADIEHHLSDRKYNYIPKKKLNSTGINDGDIIAMTVSGKGMDIMHMGIAVHINNDLYFLHASSTGKRVMVTPVPFKEYSAGIKSNTGYMIARPLEVNR